MGQNKKTNTIILHLSDLHFGWDGTELQGTDRTLALNGLRQCLPGLEPEWKPNTLLVTGDIGWKGKQSDYKESKLWLQKLFEATELSAEALFLCPGNHDLKRSLAKTNSRPSTAKEADEVLSSKNVPEHFQKPFEDYISFCREMGLHPYKIGDIESYLFGSRTLGELNVICINSAWFSKDKEDKGKLWLGLPLIKHLEENGHLPHPNTSKDRPVTIALLHHPREWLHDYEIHAYSNRKNTFDYLAERCHIILSGHTHGEVRKADQIAEHAWHLFGGAAFAGASHFNSFRLIQIFDNKAIYRSFEFDPKSTDNCWPQKGGAGELILGARTSGSLQKNNRQPTFDLQAYISKAEDDSKRLIEAKSRALKPFGKLPKTVPLFVSAEIEIRPPRISNKGQLISEGKKERNLLPLFKATRQHRRTLLLGDLGTGKSTLAGCLVTETMKTNNHLLSFVIPAKALRLSQPLTIKVLLKAISKYFNDQIAPALNPLDIESLLKQGVEISLVVDGLDEVSKGIASSILNQLAALVDHWPCIQVLATGRPVELQGVNYGNWKLLSTAILTDEDRLHLFKEEVMGDGKNLQEANDLADRLLRKLKSTPTLYAISNSPLSIRLLYPNLFEGDESGANTLGDLLSKLIEDRLGHWAAKDGKQSATPNFEAKFPDIEFRSDLLSIIALELKDRISMPREEAIAHLKAFIKNEGYSNEHILAKEALDFYAQSGIVIVDEHLHFTIQPFFEYLCGVGLMNSWRQAGKSISWLDTSHWRLVSFAASAIRRHGFFEELRPKLVQFLDELLIKENNTAAASYIVSEAKDESIAKAFINKIDKIALRPLHVFWDDRQQSARSIAESIILAGEVGFEWFYTHYLEPRYPFVFAGSAVPEAVFTNWAYFRCDSITDHERKRLKSLVRPHIEAGTYQLHSIIPILAILIPEAFTLHEKLWFYAQLLNKDLFAKQAEEILSDAFNSEHRQLVNDILLKTLSIPAVSLWFKLNHGRPTAKVAKTAIKALGSARQETAYRELVENCISRIGNEGWKRLLRWCLFDSDSHISSGASIGLYKLGERSLSILGKPLLRAMHDGGYVPKSEIILTKLICDGGDKAVRWLSERIAAKKSGSIDSAHSGWWRILLLQLESIKKDGPKILASCMGSIDPFLLPRYPEVRQGFKDLLQGTHGELYYKELRKQLFNIDPAIRHGAALLLLIADPKNESQALETIIRSVSIKEISSWHELYGFLLSLKFGPTVLSYIESKLNEFDSSAATYALAILHKNDFQLDDAGFGKLVRGLLGNMFLCHEVPELEKSVFGSEDALKPLKTIIEQRIDWTSQYSAEKILQYHNQNISEQLRARCNTIILEGSLLDEQKLNREIEKIKTDNSYSQIVEEVSADITKKNGKRPLIALINKAIGVSTAWEDVVWRILCDVSGLSSEMESGGQWLLDHGRLNLDHGRAIGKAAGKFLKDPRVRQTRFGETVQWLALLADEFVGLSKEHIEKALLHGNVIKDSVTCALIARLGKAPKGFDRRKQSTDVPHPSELQSDSVVLADYGYLQELARESEKLHPDVCNVLEEMSLRPELPTEQQNALADEGINGIFVASALSFIYEQQPNPQYIIPVLLNFRPIAWGQKDPCQECLIRIWRNGQLIQIAADPKLRVELIKLLDKTIVNSERFDTLVVASQLLALRGNLTKSQVSQVLEQYGRHPEYIDRFGLTSRLSIWLSQELSAEVKKAVVQALKRGISLLDSQPWDTPRGAKYDPCRFLLFSLAYWLLTNTVTDESVRVFWRGLKFMHIQPIERHDRLEPHTQPHALQVFEKLEPIILHIPKSTFNQALISGNDFDDPIVRGLTKLFAVGQNKR
ncbi:MAG: hypothetical protein BBJ57_04430 [Desulfobacterales bacterium PC51MH44]|nr:MAG: hypothetical protein BBJ57_04430 [Desulfobacterales bacterium PC51MH44]